MVTATTTKKPPKKAAKPAEPVQLELFKETAPAEVEVKAKKVNLIDYLRTHVMEVTLEVNWFATSKKVDEASAKSMLAVVGAASDAVGMSKRLFGSGHPLVKAANKAKQALLAYRDSVTAAVAKTPPLDMAEEEAKAWLAKEPGTRLIETTQIDEFDKQIIVLVGTLKTAVKALNAGLADVKAFDQKRLQKLYREEDYPDKVEAEVRGPHYKEVSYSADFEKLAPGACERMKQALYHRLSGGIDLTVADFARGLVDFAKQLANQLGNRVRLMPPKTHPKAYLRDAEVIEFCTSKSDPEVPEGKVMANLRYTKSGKSKSSTEWLEFTLEEWTSLQPFETDERKKVYESTLDNLKDQCQAIKNVAKMLGEFGKPILDAAMKLEDLMGNIGSNSKEILDELRASGMVRKQTVKALKDLSSVLSTQMKTVPTFERRRSIGKFKNKPKDDEE